MTPSFFHAVQPGLCIPGTIEQTGDHRKVFKNNDLLFYRSLITFIFVLLWQKTTCNPQLHIRQYSVFPVFKKMNIKS